MGGITQGAYNSDARVRPRGAGSEGLLLCDMMSVCVMICQSLMRCVCLPEVTLLLYIPMGDGIVINTAEMINKTKEGHCNKEIEETKRSICKLIRQ